MPDTETTITARGSALTLARIVGLRPRVLWWRGRPGGRRCSYTLAGVRWISVGRHEVRS